MTAIIKQDAAPIIWPPLEDSRLVYYDSMTALYCCDYQEILLDLPIVDHIITDPPYTERVHKNARTTEGTRRRDAPYDARRIEFGFEPLLDVADLVAQLLPRCRRWLLAFCAFEHFGEYAAAGGDSWVRGCLWVPPNRSPQFTGDRPAQPGDGIACLHAPGRKRWNGRGKRGLYTTTSERSYRVHPTEKPLRLMSALVGDFTDPGETILDPFAGSGSTLAAAKQRSRRAIGIEREATYCAAAVERLRHESFAFG